MKIKVVKNNGVKEEFREEKIAQVVKAAGLTEEKAAALAQKVAEEIRMRNEKEVSSKLIRKMVTRELKEADNYAYGLYVWYEKVKEKDGH